MARLTVNRKRFDPYRKFSYRVRLDGRHVLGVSKLSGLKRSTESVEHRDGGDPSTSRRLPGRAGHDPIRLERGITHDPEFERWASKVRDHGSGSGPDVSFRDFRKDLLIDVYDEAGKLALSYKLLGAWVSEFQAFPDLDANANAVAIQLIKLEHEGCELAYEVA
jgi:phage tail-like protein